MSASRTKRVWIAVGLVAVLLAGLRLYGTGRFMFDRTDTALAVWQPDRFGIRHNCFTCYMVAAELAAGGADNIYDVKLYRKPKQRTHTHDEIGKAFGIDHYPYPPTFLLLPGVLRATGAGFFRARTIWFVLTVLVLGLALVSTAVWAGALRSAPLLRLAPLVLAAPTTAVALQIGNVHPLMIALTILGMIAFEKKRPVLGGALLGFAIGTKIWPAVFVVYLLLTRRFKAAAWTVAAVAAYAAATLFAFGTQPFEAFADYQLPRLESGEAFGFMATSAHAITDNISVFSFPHKLHRLGITGAKPALLAPLLAWGYTGLLVVLTLGAGLRECRGGQARLRKLQVWLSLIVLAQLSSPFLPRHYGVIAGLWLLLVLFASARGAWRWVHAAGWLVLAATVPLPFGSSTADLWFTMLGSLVCLGAGLAGLLVPAGNGRAIARAPLA